MLLHQHHMFDQDLRIIGEDTQHAAFFTLVAAGDHFHRVVAPNIDALVFSRYYRHFLTLHRTF